MTARGCRFIKVCKMQQRNTLPSMDNTAYYAACRDGDEAALDTALADASIDVHHRRDGAIRIACRNGHTGIVRRLLALTGDRALNVGEYGGRAFFDACAGGHVDIVKLLLAHEQRDVFPYEESRLIACGNGHVGVLELFQGFTRNDVDKATTYKRTAVLVHLMTHIPPPVPDRDITVFMRHANVADPAAVESDDDDDDEFSVVCHRNKLRGLLPTQLEAALDVALEAWCPRLLHAILARPPIEWHIEVEAEESTRPPTHITTKLVRAAVKRLPNATTHAELLCIRQAFEWHWSTRRSSTLIRPRDATAWRTFTKLRGTHAPAATFWSMADQTPAWHAARWRARRAVFRLKRYRS